MASPLKAAKKRKVKRNRPGFRGEPSDTGRKLLVALARAGWNGSDLAREMGVSALTITRWLSGECGLSAINQMTIRKLLGADAC
jgi:plasmid maintenance system antidote protein VapI